MIGLQVGSRQQPDSARLALPVALNPLAWTLQSSTPESQRPPQRFSQRISWQQPPFWFPSHILEPVVAEPAQSSSTVAARTRVPAKRGWRLLSRWPARAQSAWGVIRWMFSSRPQELSVSTLMTAGSLPESQTLRQHLAGRVMTMPLGPF